MRATSFVKALAAAAMLVGCAASAAQAQTAERKQPPPPAPERHFTFPSHTTTRLENGLTVFVVEDHRQPMVSATLMLPGAGSSSHPGAKAGLASTAAALLRQGTTTRSAQQIAEAIDRVGGSLGASAGVDTTQVSLTVITTALDTGFDLLADIVQRPAFAAAEIERLRRQSLSGLQVAYSDPEYLRDVVAQRVAYGDHPYAYPPDGTPGTVKALTRDDIVGFFKEHYSPSGSYLAIAGDITPDAAAALARKHFGGWKGAAATPPALRDVRHQRRIVIVDKPDAVQTQFGLVQPGVPRNHPDWLALTVANQILGGGFNSRLNMRLRANEGLTYGARSGVESFRHAGLLTATSFTRTEATAKAIELTMDVIGEFRKKPVTREELAEATSYLSGVFAIQTETADGVAGRVLTSALHQLPADYWQTYRKGVRDITAAEIAGAVERHVVPDRMSIIAVGNAGAFAKSIESMGPVTIVPVARVDLTQPDLAAPQEKAAGPGAEVRGMELIRAAAKAVGGARTLSGVKDVTSTGEVTLVSPAGELRGQTSATVLYPDKVRVVITLPTGELVQVSDGNQGWFRMGAQPAAEIPPALQVELQRAAVLSGGVGVLREALEGRAEVAALESKSGDGGSVQRVSWKKGDLEMVLAFDPGSHRIASVTYRGMTMQGPAESELRVDEYKPAANGLMVPMRATTYQNGQKAAELVISEWRFNTGVAPAVFVKPQ
ncbi:MAG TPA: pitrilysin family protein [Vicinamibacterales bacterium]|nr:pitrilysin family protein [Vicinamibacterales bacterium]